MRYGVDTSELQDVIAQLAAFEARLEQRIADADRTVATLHATWTGRAAAEHRAAHARWTAAQAQMQDALARLRAIAATAHGNYSGAVAANTSMWDAL